MLHPDPNPVCRPKGAASHVLDPFEARRLALKAGFNEAKLVSLPYPEAERDASRFSGWIGAGRAATMRYLERAAEDGRLIRARVEVPFPWARSAIVCFASYASPSEPLSIDKTDQRKGSLTNPSHQPALPSKDSRARTAWVARYAWSSRIDPSGKRVPSDYHKVLLKRLRALEARLREEFGEFESHAYVDTGPVVERSLAVAAGLGWTGKNTCLIHPKLGSFGFLAVLLTGLECNATSEVYDLGNKFSSSDDANLKSEDASAPENIGGRMGLKASEIASASYGPSGPGSQAALLPHPNLCGSCTRCIEACPTNALDQPYQMDANRCIAYLTIEHKGPIAAELMPGIGRQIFGCDICQDVCPWNQKSRRSAPIQIDPDLEPRAELINPTLEWLASLDEPSFEKLFNGSPVRRTGFNGLRRNIAIAMGNSGLAAFVPKLKEWAEAADEGLRHAARWARMRLLG